MEQARQERQGEASYEDTSPKESDRTKTSKPTLGRRQFIETSLLFLLSALFAGCMAKQRKPPLPYPPTPSKEAGPWPLVFEGRKGLIEAWAGEENLKVSIRIYTPSDPQFAPPSEITTLPGYDQIGKVVEEKDLTPIRNQLPFLVKAMGQAVAALEGSPGVKVKLPRKLSLEILAAHEISSYAAYPDPKKPEELLHLSLSPQASLGQMAHEVIGHYLGQTLMRRKLSVSKKPFSKPGAPFLIIEGLAEVAGYLTSPEHRNHFVRTLGENAKTQPFPGPLFYDCLPPAAQQLFPNTPKIYPELSLRISKLLYGIAGHNLYEFIKKHSEDPWKGWAQIQKQAIIRPPRQAWKAFYTALVLGGESIGLQEFQREYPFLQPPSPGQTLLTVIDPAEMLSILTLNVDANGRISPAKAEGVVTAWNRGGKEVGGLKIASPGCTRVDIQRWQPEAVFFKTEVVFAGQKEPLTDQIRYP